MAKTRIFTGSIFLERMELYMKLKNFSFYLGNEKFFSVLKYDTIQETIKGEIFRK